VGGRLANKKSELDKFDPATLLSKVKSLCTKSLTANCPNAPGTYQDTPIMTCDTSVGAASTNCPSDDAGAFDWTTATLEGHCDDIVTWSDSLQAVLIKNYFEFNSKDEIVGIKLDDLWSLYPNTASKPSAFHLDGLMYGSVARMMGLTCWVNQLDAETQPDFPSEVDTQAKLSKFMGGIFKDGAGERRFVMRLSDGSSRCGGPATTNTTLIPHYGWYSIGTKTETDEALKANGINTKVTIANLGRAGCGTGCSDGYPSIVDPLTGSYECCARPSWWNALSAAYAFALLWLSVAALTVAGLVALIWGKGHVDMDELKEGFGENEQIGTMKGQASSAASGAAKSVF
jgi:hypothetical protein